MAPAPTTQQDLDVLERIGKLVGALVIIGGAFAALTRWLRASRARKEKRYAERVERIVRAAFAAELSGITAAIAALERIERDVISNTSAIADIQKETIRLLASGDEMTGLVISAIRENREWIDDLQTFTDHVHGIDRRSSIGEDRRKRLSEQIDAIEERRGQRRRAADRVREELDATRERMREIELHNEVE